MSGLVNVVARVVGWGRAALRYISTMLGVSGPAPREGITLTL